MELLTTLAKQFQASGIEGLLPNNTIEAIRHDAIHMALNLGVELESEELVLNVESALSGGEVNPKLESKVADLIANLSFEFILAVSDSF